MHDGVATTEEADDAIRYGAGHGRSFMGTFLIYRLAGGEAGMRHFSAQFGPALQLPWTKLMDVPELTDAFIDQIAHQSDRCAIPAAIAAFTPAAKIAFRETTRSSRRCARPTCAGFHRAKCRLSSRAADRGACS